MNTALSIARRVRAAAASWQDPAARHARAMRHARAAVRHRVITAAALGGATAVAIPMGGGPGAWDLLWAAATAGVATAAGFSIRTARALEHESPPPRAPRRGSAARPAINRIIAAHLALDNSLCELAPMAGDTAAEAAAAEQALRALAARVTAVESALAVAPEGARAGLAEALQVLVDQLFAGVTAYERLVVAAADAVAASGGGGDAFAVRRLEAASDSLAGLAAGLRDLHAAGS